MNYQKITENAYYIALNYLPDEDSAREIAQLTAIEAFLNRDSLREDSLNNWVFTVAKNKTLNYIRNNQKSFEVEQAFFERYEEAKEGDLAKDDFLRILAEIPLSVIDQKDRSIFLHYLKRGMKGAARDRNENPDSFRKKIYRLKKEIILYHEIQSGKKCLDPIPGTKLHSNLFNFIKKMTTCIGNNDFSLFDKFEMDDKSRQRLQHTSISQIVKYQADLLSKSVYEIFLFYFDDNERMDSLRFQIKINDRGCLQLISFPQMPKKILMIKNENIPTELREKLKPGKDGLIPLSRQELEKEISEKVEEIEILYDLDE